MQHKFYTLKKFVIILIVFTTLQLLDVVRLNIATDVKATPIQASANSEHLNEALPLEQISAVVMVKSASGESYMADRDDIATMPELKTQEEIENFVARYEPTPEDMQRVSLSLDEAGFNIIAQDNLFITISGSPELFQSIVPDIGVSIARSPDSKTLIFTKRDISQSTDHGDLLDGMILYLAQEDMTTINIHHPQASASSDFAGNSIRSYQADYTDVRKALKLDRVRAKGAGVRVGFIENSGVYAAHPFFITYPANIRFMKFVNGNISFVGNNFTDKHNDNHATVVASYLINSAPEATFYAMALPTPNDIAPSNSFISYLTFINQYHLIDILSLSIGFHEEEPWHNTAEVRLQLINFINHGGIVLVAGGNAGQCDSTLTYCSGHNAWAAIPEVIAVGGSELVPVGSGFIFRASSVASSFSSTLYPGRRVPDIVSISSYLKLPNIKDNGYYYGNGGTSSATPQIAGMIALLKQTIPDLNQEQAKSNLRYNSFDIFEGSSGDGDHAGIGYDYATGYGQPLATWVLQNKVTLYPGWNFIGVTSTYPYTAVNLLSNIQEQGGKCNTLSVYREGLFDTIIIDESGNLYGFDFTISPEEAIWIRCSKRVYWIEPGTKYIESVIPIQFSAGLNGISIPYANNFCSASDIVKETNGVCWTVSEYDGRFQPYTHRNGVEYGNDMYLSSGSGYYVYCDSRFLWMPTCSGLRNADEIDAIITPENIFNNINPSSYELQRSLMINDNSTEFLSSTNCEIKNVKQSNVSGNTFSISWTTDDPCPGSLLIGQGEGSGEFQAFDDRGLNYSGTTHHVTVRGLDGETTYNYRIISGVDVDDSRMITTGKSLPQPDTAYSAEGSIIDENWNLSPDTIIYAWLQDGTGNLSSQLSFGLSQMNEGYTFVIGNARQLDQSSYFNLLSAAQLHLYFQGGSTGVHQINLPISLSTTPQVTINTIIIAPRPGSPRVITPDRPIIESRPTFKFLSHQADDIQYRLEISRDNFNSIAYVFDQRKSRLGWSSTSYADGQEASFTIPNVLENRVGYQWRVFAFDTRNSTWSHASEIVGFSTLRHELFLPLLIK